MSGSDLIDRILFGLILVTFFGALIAGGIYMGIIEPMLPCVKYKTVVEIGGCNANSCGVTFDDNSYGQVNNPVKGMQRCVEKAWKKP